MGLNDQADALAASIDSVASDSVTPLWNYTLHFPCFFLTGSPPTLKVTFFAKGHELGVVVHCRKSKIRESSTFPFSLSNHYCLHSSWTQRLQANLGDIGGLVTDHLNKANITVK